MLIVDLGGCAVPEAGLVTLPVVERLDVGGQYLFDNLPAGTYEASLVVRSVTGELTTAPLFKTTIEEDRAFLDADFGVALTLPKTGTDAEKYGLIALFLLAVGLVAVVGTRKRRQETG